MKIIAFLIQAGVIIAALACFPNTVEAHPHIIDAKDKIEIPVDILLEELESVQVIFFGEFHDHVGHHQAQLSLIDAIKKGERPLAVGLEMFRRDSQIDLDVWTSNKMPLLDFLKIYEDNWSMWPKYSEIFLYARDESLKMVGLNISREITRKVASTGFKSLSIKERELLGNVQCEVDPSYEQFIKRAMGGYGGHGDQFLFFCEAQLLWDTAMARNIIEFLEHNPDYRMVVLAGSGHAWKFGIPRQLLDQSDISFKVILPEIPGRADRNNVTEDITDYLWLDEGDDGWSF
ncbi:MAG: ChaN family lipoprotein [Deltaproteobacteria bacterium]|jgi:uncharacterized iron-regulated protein|nr:ChaN family lipoprotein [Deltaproteobacteria bacterium]MBW2505124.1 ChaN family lipoprotein [Deltaproteobacteria bacterium]